MSSQEFLKAYIEHIDSKTIRNNRFIYWCDVCGKKRVIKSKTQYKDYDAKFVFICKNCYSSYINTGLKSKRAILKQTFITEDDLKTNSVKVTQLKIRGLRNGL